MGTPKIELAHLSDTHVGYEAYKALSASGENQRAVDIVRAFVTCVDEIVQADPPLVIHSGDVADRTVIPYRLVRLVQQQFARLAGIRPDGTRRQLVVIAGNHELPRNKKEACFLELIRNVPGIHIITTGYTLVEFTGEGLSSGADPELADVVVHGLPHDTLKEIDFADVRPIEGKINILSAHGVAGGSELYVRSLGREFAIPTDVLVRDWEYGALGHWHKQGPVPLVGAGGKQGDPSKGRIWYAGSPENMGFGDLRDNGTQRGWLYVTCQVGREPEVTRRNIPIRTMMRLPHVDATGLSPDEITSTLLSRLSAAEIHGAIVAQVVEGVPRDTWGLVDLPKVRAAAASALHYEVAVRYQTSVKQDGESGDRQGTGLGDVDRMLEARAAEILEEHEREGGLNMARNLVAVEIERSAKGDAGKVAAQLASVESDTAADSSTLESTVEEVAS